MTARGRRSLRPILAAAAAVVLVSVLGALATDIGPWYYALKKPAWQPPDWLFGPVWTLIFGLAGLSGILAWREAAAHRQRVRIIVFFVANMSLNTLWSVLFFRLHRPDWALVEVGFLWFSIVALMTALFSLSHVATWLLLPYLAWVSFASFLNLAIVRLNAPFAS